MERQETQLEKYKRNFMSALSQMDKKTCIQLWTELLASAQYDIPSLYEGVLVPSLNEIAQHDQPQRIPVWEEHLRSGIVRTALELTYPYVLNQIQSQSQQVPTNAVQSPLKALVLCMEEEYHEMGARMVSDYLQLLDFEVFFIGANTPNKDVVGAVKEIVPQLVVISITNFYHLFKLQALISDIKAAIRKSPIIVLGGYAIDHTPEVRSLVSPDYFARVFQDFVRIKEELL